MTYTLTRTGDTFTVLNNGTPVFTGSMLGAMAEHKRLSLAAKGPAKAGDKMARREERKQGGQRV